MSEILPKLVLKPKHAQPFYARHPWVYAGSIAETPEGISDGAEVDIVNHTGDFVARGLYNSNSKIRVRLYSWDETVRLDREFWRNRLTKAIEMRHHTLHLNHCANSAYRVVFGEADFLSGIVVDRYASHLTVQITSLAMGQRLDIFVDLLRELLSPKGIYLRTEKGIGRLEGLTLQDGLIWGEVAPKETEINENNLRFVVNLAEGQKTGYYLDQRDNRSRTAKFCIGKRVLDAFCYSGGFGIYAAKAGAEHVTCVDASEAAIELAKKNSVINALPQFDFVADDVFSFLAKQVAAGIKYDVVILDPPKFARDRKAVPDAIRGYRRLHSLAMKLINPDGILVSCCCSGLVTASDLEDVIAQCAVQAKRDMQILERRGPASDHPVAISCRESGYLKCIIAKVM